MLNLEAVLLTAYIEFLFENFAIWDLFSGTEVPNN